MWDVNLVLTHLQNSKSDNVSLSDKDLTEKLAMLLALTSAGRSSELDSFDVRFMQMTEGKVVFHLAKLTKGRKRGSCPLQAPLKTFHQNPSLCVVNCLKVHTDRTSDRRKVNGKQTKNQLLLGTVKPYVEVISSTIARWLKNVMKDAGIDVSIFKGHSVRWASTSKAAAQGFSVREIMDRANWSGASTFKTFYHKVQQYNNFEEAVLDIRTGAS